jgi:alkylated DNA repair dioxygenase AlkB
METLFPLEPHYPEGFSYTRHFISEDEELLLLEAIRQIPLHTFKFQGYEARRKVASFGYDWNFEKQALLKGQPTPADFNWLLQRLSAHLHIAEKQIAEILITEYPVGAVINWHRDAPPFDTIAGISLLSDALFKFRPHNKATQTRRNIMTMSLERRSLYTLEGRARSDWQHSIAAVKKVRYSITMRTLKPGF